MTNFEIGTRVGFVAGTTREGSVVKVQKNGRIVVLAEAVYQEKTGRRLYAEQRFTLEPSDVRAL